MRLALPKGRNLDAARKAFDAAGIDLSSLDGNRRLCFELPGVGMEVLLLKDWDLPLYVEQGIADWGIVGTDVLSEVGGDLLVPVALTEGRSRISLIGRAGSMPRAGQQVRLASKYPLTARRYLESQPWGAEVFKLSGSVELAPLLDLAEVAVDIVQTGRTLRENDLVELEEIAEVAPCFVVNRAAYQKHRRELNRLLERFEAAGVAA